MRAETDFISKMIAKACPEYSLSKKSTLVAISGSGNVAQFTALKVIELGGTVLSLSDSKGAFIAESEEGFLKEDVEAIGQLKLKGGSLESFTNTKGKYKYHAGARPWALIPKVHIALPGATQNEVSKEEAEALVKAGVRIVAEGSNMVRLLFCRSDSDWATTNATFISSGLYEECSRRIRSRSQKGWS